VLTAKEETFTVSSSSIRIERKTVPKPHPRSKPVQQPPPPQKQTATAVHQPPAARQEIARENPQAPPQPQRVHREATLAETLAQQEKAFAHESQTMHANNNPYSIATIDPNQRVASEHPFHMDISGSHISSHGEGYLDPLQRWKDHGFDCYYGHYTWYYPEGGTEEANIPWAFCYAPLRDPILAGLHQFPFPLPLPGYRLPPGTSLEPIEKETYEAWLSQQR
jgi:hypothetical protein